MSKIPLPWSALERVHDHFFRIASSIVSSGESVEPQIFKVRANREGRVTRLAALAPTEVQWLMGTPEGKSHLLTVVTALLSPRLASTQDFKADLLVQVGEAWASFPGTAVPPSEDPERREVVMVVLQLPGLTVPVHHFIESAPTRRLVRTTFPALSDVGQVGGNLAQQAQKGPGPGDALH